MPWTPHLRTADIVLVTPSSLLGRLIVAAECLNLPWGEVRTFSHAAPLLRLEHPLELPHVPAVVEPGLYTVDAVSSGLVLTSLAAQVIAGAEMQVRRIPDEVRALVGNEVIDDRACAWVADNVGRVSYDHVRLAWFLFRMPFNWFPTRVVKRAKRALLTTVCSSWTSATLRDVTAGVVDPATGEPYDPVAWRNDRWTSPSDLGRRDARLDNLRDAAGNTVWVLRPDHFTVKTSG